MAADRQSRATRLNQIKLWLGLIPTLLRLDDDYKRAMLLAVLGEIRKRTPGILCWDQDPDTRAMRFNFEIGLVRPILPLLYYLGWEPGKDYSDEH